MWYYNTRKREGKPNKPERKKEMEFYSMEQFEIMSDLMEDYQEWLDFEEDMKSNPYGD
jgi:hypothetical protein